MKENFNLKIHEKSLNTKYKIIPFNIKKNDTGNMKYLPPFFKEWKNTAYFYNKNIIKNLSINNILINKIIKSYFNLLFLNYRNLTSKKKRTFLKDIYISNINIKFTNSIAVITLYTINLRKYLFKKYMNYFNYYSINKEWIRISNKKRKQKKILKRANSFAFAKILKEKLLRFIGINTILLKYKKKFKYINLPVNNLKNIRDILDFKFKFLNKGLEAYSLYKKIYLIKQIKHMYYKYLIVLYKYNYLYFLNNYKFKNGNSSFIPKLKSKLSIILNKKIELNVINLKSITFNPDIFTKVLSKKLMKKNFNVVKSMITIINKGKLLTKNLTKKNKLLKNRDLQLLDNKYKDLSLISNINNNFSDFLNNIYPINKSKSETSNNLSKIIFNTIKYKNMAGIRLEVKGRLTRRYRADRAIYKLQWKGGLKNTDSSLKKLSSVMFRGNLKSNVVYSISKSKRRIGSFAVKGWISGK